MKKPVAVPDFATLRRIAAKPQSIAFLPAIFLAAYWFGGEAALIVSSVIFPAAVYAFYADRARPHQRDGQTGLPLRPAFITTLDGVLETSVANGRTTACLMIEIENLGAISASYGVETTHTLQKIAAKRIVETVREHDIVAKLAESRFAVALAPVHRADLETLIQLSSRIQAALAEPYSINASKIYGSASIGFCTPTRAPAQTAAAYIDAAEVALLDAIHNGSGSIRAYSSDLTGRQSAQTCDPDELGAALENGHIVPWFQPQVSTDTGEVTGMEALARWEHPERGVILPATFLPVLEELGLLERLGEVIRFHALSALRDWDQGDIKIGSISVNFTATELANPKLVEKLTWELDRFDLSPDRLEIEILENVIAATDDDIIPRNIRALKAIGCRIDLDDYGTGHASIANIRRFSVDRIKIDRSYVARCDRDREQQNMLTAILTMAEQLNLETLAEGVETLGEHAMLAQLGCGYVQGFSVSRPLPEANVSAWLAQHNTKIASTPPIGRHAG
ncbi:putative bifunctional diguanylate cyclase/phosphodiesterase [Celeribacter marinus]|uniref:putative bifunctional diguanylate cyclase/phosphodiesterase n=1 Tax=Celeribacter marinus TaxID=1397108 RepID=UPI003F6C4E5C